MASSPDGDRTEIDGQHVEGCFGAAEDGPGELCRVAVGAARLDDLRKESGGGTAAEGSHQDQREDLRWKTDQVEHGGKEAGQDVDSPGRSEDADGDKDGHEVGEDPQGDLDALLGAFDEFLVDGDAPEGGVEREKP